MNPLQERLARLGLVVTARHGFVLAGGNAITAHGLSERPTRDVDLFTNDRDPERFATAVAEAVRAYEQAGLTVEVRRQVEQLVQLRVRDEVGREVEVEFAVDYRAEEPAQLQVGPVLSRDDAVAAKMAAMYGRGEPRDFLDVDAALTSGAYTRDQLVQLADARAPQAMDRDLLASQLRYGASLASEEFTDYGLDVDRVEALRSGLREWARTLP